MPSPEGFRAHFQQYAVNIISLVVFKLHPKGNINLISLGCKKQKPILSSLKKKGFHWKGIREACEIKEWNSLEFRGEGPRATLESQQQKLMSFLSSAVAMASTQLQ